MSEPLAAANGRDAMAGGWAGGRAPAGVQAQPFRPWMVAPQHAQSLAVRYATPWDQDADNGYTSPHEARNILRAWQRSGALVRDPQAAMYAYDQTGPRGSLRGLLAAVHLDSTLLPYQQVIPARADGVAQLMRIGEMNLDPLLLGYSGDGRTAELLAEVTRYRPLTEVVATDGQTHRLWRITGRDAHADIADELGTRAALIADGHHRHAAARELRRELVASGQDGGPWNYLPGLLVDVTQRRPTLRPVHRLVPMMDPGRALRAADGPFRVTPLRGDLRDWAQTLAAQAARGPAFVVAAPRGAFLLSDPDPRLLAGTLRQWPPQLRGMHVAILHAALLGALWRVPQVPPHVRYEGSTGRAVRQVQENGGIAVLLAAPGQADLHAAAAAGVPLPAKSASFGPAPHPGLLLRTVAQGE